MDEKIGSSKIQIFFKIILWSAILVFFIYSYQSIMTGDTVTPVYRKEFFIRVISALSKPNLGDSETNYSVVTRTFETIQMAFLGTLMGAILASMLTLVSARKSSALGRGLNSLLQIVMTIIKSAHPLITVLFVIIIYGIGPKSGVITLTIFSTAMLFVIYSDYAQNNKYLDWTLLFKYFFPGLALKQLSVNLLIASVLGFMGGGGIGFFIQQSINLLDYSTASTGLLACIAIICVVDLISRDVWKRLLKSKLV